MQISDIKEGKKYQLLAVEPLADKSQVQLRILDEKLVASANKSFELAFFKACFAKRGEGFFIVLRVDGIDEKKGLLYLAPFMATSSEPARFPELSEPLEFARFLHPIGPASILV